jgi:hypothetical protein
MVHDPCLSSFYTSLVSALFTGGMVCSFLYDSLSPVFYRL